MIIAEYIWLDSKKKFRSKSRTIYNIRNNKYCPKSYPDWTYDGSSTDQADSADSEIILHPVAIYKCPFRSKTFNMPNTQYAIVLCETYHRDKSLTRVNTRYEANKVFNKLEDKYPWYGLEQEYFIINPQTKKPIGWPINGIPEKQGKYYCGVGTGNVFGRDIVEKHYEYCIYAGLKISGINAEVAPGQWEFQIGPCTGISAGDQLWVARYILERLAEEYKVEISYDPKPITGNWNGSGCHTNFSTQNMREGDTDIGTDGPYTTIKVMDGVTFHTKNDHTVQEESQTSVLSKKSGLDYINDAIVKLSHKHDEHMAVYGDGNERRMTGEHETSSYNSFTSDVANRGCSVRIPAQTATDTKGYFEDRRPSSNCDPYLVTSKILLTVCGYNDINELIQ
jgi:glutamine synthetase